MMHRATYLQECSGNGDTCKPHNEVFIKYRGVSGAQDAGKWLLEGKEYIMQESDVVHFRFDV